MTKKRRKSLSVNALPFLYFPCSPSFLRWFSLSFNGFSLFLFFYFFPFKYLLVHIIFRFLDEKSTSHLWITLFCAWSSEANSIGRGKTHQDMWNTLFCIFQFEAKYTGRGKIHQVPVNHAFFFNLAFLKPNS